MLTITPVKILKSIFRQIGTAPDAQKLAMHSILDTHSSDIVDIAYGDAKWNVAKDTARALLLEILSADIEKTKKAIKQRINPKAAMPTATAVSTVVIWKKIVRMLSAMTNTPNRNRT